jgi:hypothetical protein
MKKYIWILILIIWMLAACAPKPTEQSLLPNDDSYPNDSYPNQSYPNENDSSSQLPTGMTPAISAAITALSGTLNLPPGQITIVSAEAVEWRDGCLGVQKIGVMCTQVIVPGYKIILEVNGEQYEFHTDEDGSTVVQVKDEVFGSVEAQVINQLASNLGLNESDISIISNVDIEFSDACLGVAMHNVVCAEMVTPGKIIVLEANGVQYEYHVSNDGTHVQPATLALTWTREGGIAGFCDSLTVFLSGEVYGDQCRSEPNSSMGTFADLLSGTEREQFDTWVKELGQVDLDASDPEGVSDRMEVKLMFYGSGSGTLGKTDQQELLLWVQNLYQKLYS